MITENLGIFFLLTAFFVHLTSSFAPNFAQYTRKNLFENIKYPNNALEAPKSKPTSTNRLCLWQLFSTVTDPYLISRNNNTDGNLVSKDSQSTDSSCEVNLNWVDATDGLDIDTTLPPVIVLHGMFGSSRNFVGWAKTLPLILSKPRKVFVVDLRNHGKSDWHDSMTYEDLTSDILGLMKKLGIPRAIFVGHSIGGKIACKLALTKPQLVEGLMVLDIAPVTYTLEDDKQWQEVVTSLHILNRLPLATINSKGQADRMLAEAIPDSAKRAFCLTQLQPDPVTKRLGWALNIRALANNVDNLASFDTTGLEQQNAFQKEVLFVAGGKSRFLRSSHLPTIAALFPKFTLVTVRDTGHWLHIDAAERTLELAKSYIERDGWQTGEKVGQKPFFYYS